MKYDDQAASTRQRLLQFIRGLNAQSIEVDVYPLLSNEHMENLIKGRKTGLGRALGWYGQRAMQLLRLENIDVIWIHIELFPYLPAVFEQMVFWKKVPVIFDFDDAFFHVYDQHPNKAVRALLGQKMPHLLRRAAGCSCGNSYLQDYAKQFCGNSVVLPTVVDTSIYKPSPRREGSDQPLVIGWIGSPTTWPYVEAVLPVLQDVAGRLGATIRIVGAGDVSAGYEHVEFKPWSHATEISDVQAMDIGIMPLPDEPWTRGKSGYKLIQYMACGLPVVASPVGVNSEIVKDGENGFLAPVPEDWANSIEKLAANPALREKMGKSGRAHVEQKFSLQETISKFENLLRSVAG